ncbi:elongation factor P hydroxylase [Salinicola corii]|uniref:Elongation factor P hydroxylase n=1 Tax=Salinicola corii TaxID=2606937 RepID=A0A640WCQ5_9GAMM|nr:elongation factor P hydroxylase [Salinicola corii]KAA0017730.1 elongation factor P hydroxylase [Salinicola corii]
MTHDIEDLIALFDGIFADSHRTRLVRGEDEPIYLPSDAHHDHHRIVFAHGFFASALHEISHWCIAGEARRQLEDYGYWYEPDGRDAERQVHFECVEAAPQALEALFSEACRKPFEVSIDNLDGVEVDRGAFSAKVAARAAQYRREGVPMRAQALIDALAVYSGGGGIQAAVAAGRQRLVARGATRPVEGDADGGRA